MKKIVKTIILILIIFISTLKVDAATLNCDNVYRIGSFGENVKTLQKRLNEEMGCNLKIDGDFGSKTYSCVKKYQKEHDLKQDGVVGEKTCASLNNTTSEELSNELENPNNSLNKIYTTTTDVNFRQGPSTSYKTNGILNRGTEVLVLEYTTSDWYKVEYNNKVGYVASRYLVEKVTTPLKSNEYIVTGSQVNVRSGASTSYKVVTTVKRGNIVTVTGKKNNWYKIKVNNKTGYIRNDYLTRDLVIVDISDQMLYYFKGDKTLLQVPVVTGMNKSHDTPLGNYTLYTTNKETNRYLRGYNDDGSRYNAYVNYWMPFNGGVGFHDATWRGNAEFNKTQYLTDGSHGCVNMKKNDAKVLYENTTVNTAVTVRK